MRVIAFVLIAAAVLACGCVYTIHPFITADTAVFDPALVGTWSMPGSAETWEFAAGEDAASYTFTYTDQEGRQGMFKALLADIDGTRFIQFTPDMDRADACGFAGMNDFYRMHFPPMHTFAVVRAVDPALVLAFPDFQRLEDYLDAHPDSAPYVKEDLLYLTGTAEQVQAFLGTIAKEDGAFSDGDPLFKAGASPEPVSAPAQSPTG